METKNLGLVKAVYHQATPPSRTDVLWWDTVNEILKSYDLTNLAWSPVTLYLSGDLTDGTPTDAEITAIVGMTAVAAGAGFRVTISDTSGTGLLYVVESDGTYWFYSETTKAV